MLDSLDYRCLQAEKRSVRRQKIYRELKDELPVLTAEAVYRHFRRTRLNSYDLSLIHISPTRCGRMAQGRKAVLPPRRCRAAAEQPD